MTTSSSDAVGRTADASATDAAASWFARLKADRVSIQDLVAFQAWRKDARNDQAYREVEALWSRGETLHGDPEIAQALSALMSRRPRTAPSRAGRIGLAVAASLLLTVTLGLWGVGSGTRGSHVYQTAVGQQEQVALADGSAVRLDTDSRLSVRLGAFERRVTLLRGRAFFSVAHDVRRPFVVAAGDARVRAVGTRFSVQRDAADVRVVLVQGVVAVSSKMSSLSASAPKELNAGQELTVNGTPSSPAPVDVALATSWLHDQLVFRNLPLKEAIAEVNRYTTRKLVLDAPGAAATPVSGIFSTADPVTFATAAADVCGLEMRPQADGTILLRPRHDQTGS